ncbi:MAG: hypothetical protein ACRD2E_03135 [Terriglobales bacterium]
MILSYPLRVVCLALAAGFLLHLALTLSVRLLSPWLERRAAAWTPRAAARWVLAWRAAPFALACAVTGGMVLPAYLRFEPAGHAEQVGTGFLLAAALGGAICLLALARWSRAALALRRLEQECRRGGRDLATTAGIPATVVSCDEPFVVLAGTRAPRVVLSRAAWQRLTPPQLEAALRHEAAHLTAGDRWRRGLLLLLPDPLPAWRGLRRCDQLWMRYSEWAADQAAAGDPWRALHLAEALLAVGCGATSRAPLGHPLGSLVSGLASDGQDLAARVNRLLAVPAAAGSVPARAAASNGEAAWHWPAALVALLTAAALLALPHAAALYPYLERLVR